MDEKKLRAVLDWPQPVNLKELQRFLGFANFYCCFIRSFRSAASPLTSMTKTTSPHLKWSTTALEAFAELKSRFSIHLCGLLEDIVSDRGPQFKPRVWSAFFQQLNINISLTSGYHSQSIGQTEHLNQEITRFLRSYCHQNQAHWSQYLMWAEYAQNSLQKPLTGLTPFQCILGFQPPLFLRSGEPTEVPSVNEWLQRSEDTWNQAHTYLCAVRSCKLIVTDAPIQNMPQVNGFGCPPKIYASDFHARNSVPDTWVPSKLLDK
ncbi:hypothetical protein M9458_013531 [Cirrhinus mrigala]|uniref:Integrase catalytic domain-containing protein n=1 Tax=Cirrhinus mrigala TaxID=683832 RepID=A0ABD0QYP3_CIRMR